MGMKHDALKAFEKVMELAPVGSKPFLKASAAVEHLKGSMLREKSVRNGGPKTSEQIISSLAESKKQTDALQLMGFASHSVIKDRQAFTNILFNEWSATLEKPESLAQLEELAKALNSDEVTQFKIMIEGHTDDRGDPQRNRELSMERARSVGHYLVKNLGVQPGRITVAGFGFSRPRVPNDTPDNRQSNRRVEVVFLGADAQEE
jgi:OOP family OmpA-OmpF porin